MSKRLSQRFAQLDLTSECLVTRFSTDGQMLATGSSDGAVRVVNPKTGAPMYMLSGGSDAMPITALRWRPTVGSKTKNVLLVASADGVIKHWHTTSQRVLSRISAPDQVYCLDYRADGDQYVAAGKDHVIRVYDDSTGEIIASCKGGGYDILGHSNRIFAVKYDPSNPSMIVSGGWDNTVILWDTRTGASVRSIYGPHICGDALDIRDNLLLAGSWRPESPLQLFDLRYMKRTQPAVEIPWSGSAPAGSGSSAALATRLATRGAHTLIYAAAFSPSGTFIAAGGSGGNEAKVFDCRGTLRAAVSTPVPASETAPSDVASASGGYGYSSINPFITSSSSLGLMPTASSSSSSSSSAAAPSSPTSLYPPPSLTATVAGLSRSVYSIAWDNADGLAVGGGDFLYVFDVSLPSGASSSSSSASAAGGVSSSSSSAATGAAPSPTAEADFFDGGRGSKAATSAASSTAAGGASTDSHPALSAAAAASTPATGAGNSGKLSAAEEAALLAAYGGAEEEADDGDEIDTTGASPAGAASGSDVSALSSGVAGMMGMLSRTMGSGSSYTSSGGGGGSGTSVAGVAAASRTSS